ncbi:MAG: helix-turn-helix domain-containing protein [Terriglobales bacterium]
MAYVNRNTSRSQGGRFLAGSKTKPDLHEIGARIRKLRGDIFQEEMADYLGISQGHLSKIERGKGAPTIETLFLLSARFRKSIDWILRGE